MKCLALKATVALLAFSTLAWSLENYTAPEPAEPIEAPVYPAFALEEGFEGECRIGLLISGDGSVRETWVVRTSGREDIDLASLDTGGETRWNPATLNGVPVSSRITVPFTFKLGILPGDPLAPVTAEPIEAEESSEPYLDLYPQVPLSIEHPGTDGDFVIIGLAVDELGLALKAWIVHSSGQADADRELLDAAYTIRWETETPVDDFIRGVYVHAFRESVVTAGDEEEEPVDEESTSQSDGACAFDQLKIGKYGQRW